METNCKCPLCGNEYKSQDDKTHHHLLPKTWYNGKGPLLEVCKGCHVEFNHFNKMNLNERWSKKDCLWRWIAFCRNKGKNAFDAYPELYKEVVG